MTTPSPTYKRAPSKDLLALFAKGEILAPVQELTSRKVGGHFHDLHFRLKDEVRVYRGLTAVLKIQRYKRGGLKITPHANYTDKLCADLNAAHRDNDVRGFRKALDDYLTDVEVQDRHTKHEGHVQIQWSRVTQPWTPFDREAVLSYSNYGRREESKNAREFGQVTEAGIELEKYRWAKLPKPGRELDQLAIDQQGRLVLLELKDTSKRSKDDAEVYYSPFQLLQYVWEWHTALEAVRNDLQAIIDARIQVGLTPRDISKLTGGIRAAIGFGPDKRSTDVKRYYENTLEIANQHLPEGMGPIETWEYTDTGPKLVT